METFVVIALVALALLLAELLLPTGGVLAGLGAVGLVAGGIVALESDSSGADYVGPAMIALGVLAAISFYVVARKVLAAHLEEPVRAGSEQLIGATAEARSAIDPEGQVWIEGALWRARLTGGADAASPPVRIGDRVTVEAVEGLTLVVRPLQQVAESPKEGAA